MLCPSLMHLRRRAAEAYNGTGPSFDTSLTSSASDYPGDAVKIPGSCRILLFARNNAASRLAFRLCTSLVRHLGDSITVIHISGSDASRKELEEAKQLLDTFSDITVSPYPHACPLVNRFPIHSHPVLRYGKGHLRNIYGLSY